MRWSRPLALAAALALAGCGGGPDPPSGAVATAKLRLAALKARGADVGRGPCLGVVAPDWVADVAHDPREDVDDEPANQCEAYRSGAATHFVELDVDGDVIRTG
jgi:hypothetical protein